ncbi:glutathione S-transferase family protein [Sulfitobacter albidus]|uniref:Glutathione S-transferase family protein n=1 Tax=Sulfitobacter albidus TaxID=2829501 RepID=A0A975JAT9_9RHOB|nr:glutathione S-transferase family protein [Sulfitobacter albidus]QUJ75058.1 glutathione S-transferase family protein [Sulfitobacter albidus]
MIVLHHCPQTRSMRPLWLLHELGVDFEVRTYPFDKTLRSPAFLAKSPAGRVPALEIGCETLFETGAITEVLCERFSPDVMGRPAGHAERGAWLSWVHFSETISQHAAALTQQHVALREDHMRSAWVMKLEAARIGKCFAALDGRLDGRDYLLDGGFSAADVSCGQAVYLARYFATFDGFERLSDWYGRISARAGFRASLPAAEERLFLQTFFAPWDLPAG